MKVKSESEVTQSCLTLSNPMDCSLRGSSVHGIFQARVLEWGAIAFSDSYFGEVLNLNRAKMSLHVLGLSSETKSSFCFPLLLTFHVSGS